MTGPLIAITAMRSASVEGLRFAGYAVSEAIVASIIRAGGTPVALPPIEETSRIDLRVFDGVLIPGGRDMDRRAYAATNPRLSVPSTAVSGVDLLHDEVEIAIVRRCIEQRIPLLAVCRGMQVLNVALGGSLIEDVPHNEVPHRSGFHDVLLDAGSHTTRVMGSPQVSVSSYHHQAVDRLGDGLVVVGRATDGCIEAVEHVDAPVLAVQWHPEDNADQAPEQQALFDALVGASITV